MRTPVIAVAVLVLAFAFGQPLLLARPEFLARYAADPFSRPERRARCATCHVSPAGGGPRNEFGQAFARNGFRVTPALRAAWPDRFLPAISALSTPEQPAAATLKATWSGSREDEVLVEVGGERYLLNRSDRTVTKVDPAQAEAFGKVPAAPPPELSVAEVQPPATFDYYLINLPTTRARPPRSLHLRFSHRFSDRAFEGRRRLHDLFGLDSFSISSFGIEAGLHRYVSFVTYRTPYARFNGGPVIEMGPVFPLLLQGGRAPLSFALRTTVEGTQNFTERYTLNVVPAVSRAFGNRAELFVVPTFSFWVPRRTLTGDFAFTPGERRNHLAAIGVGGSLRIRPRVAITGEWTPRVAGFRGLESRNTYSFGIQRATDRHVFGLTFSNTQSSTTSRAITDGLEGLRIGFNLYRRMW